jgi:NitT/TauT family transport system substrate-binding protein
MTLKRTTRDFGLVAVGICTILIIAFGRGVKSSAPKDNVLPVIRLAHFPNITHAPALVGLSKGTFQSVLTGYRIDVKVVNAGPEAMEALLAGQIDFAYVGPSPAINTFAKTKGKALTIIAGACDGGASLIRRSDVSIGSVRDLAGKTVAVPQLGGTQDVSCRKFLAANGLRPKELGGTVVIVPVKNPDMLTLFKQKQLDAAWVPEPWAARIKAETHAQTVVDERDLWPDHRFSTTVLVVRNDFAEAHPEVVQAFLRAHRDTVEFIGSQPEEAKRLVNEELKRLTGKSLPPAVIDEAWSRVTFSSAFDRKSIHGFAKAAMDAGYLKAIPPDLNRIFAQERP